MNAQFHTAQLNVAPLRDFELVYLGTPYTKYECGIDSAFIDACKLSGKLLQLGVHIYSPIAFCHPVAIHTGIDPLDHELWLSVDHAIMGKSDAMVIGMLPGWDKSFGVEYERRFFHAANKPIFKLDPITMELVP